MDSRGVKRAGPISDMPDWSSVLQDGGISVQNAQPLPDNIASYGIEESETALKFLHVPLDLLRRCSEMPSRRSVLLYCNIAWVAIGVGERQSKRG